MKKKILSRLFVWLIWILLWLWWIPVHAANCGNECNWIKLNTCFPIIWDCIRAKNTWDAEWVGATEAFPTMMWALTKIIVSVILVVCFILIIVAGVMWSSDNPTWAKKILKKVAITILLLWFSWLILKLINPTFFW